MQDVSPVSSDSEDASPPPPCVTPSGRVAGQHNGTDGLMVDGAALGGKTMSCDALSNAT